MGFGSKLKKAAKKATKTVKKSTVVVKKATKTATKVASTAKKASTAATKVASTAKAVASDAKAVANNPLVKTGLTIGATALAGPAGAQMVNTGYAVMNTDGNILDKALAAASASGVPLNFAGNVPASTSYAPEEEIVYEYEQEGNLMTNTSIDKSGFSNVAYSPAQKAAAGAANASTKSFLEKHKTKFIVGGGAVGLFVAYKILKGKKKKRR